MRQDSPGFSALASVASHRQITAQRVRCVEFPPNYDAKATRFRTNRSGSPAIYLTLTKTGLASSRGESKGRIEDTMRVSLPMMRFCRDILIGCLVLAFAWGGGFALLRVMPDVVTTVLTFSGTLGLLVAGGIFVPPLTLIVMGLARKRTGLAISPLLAAGIPAAILVWTG